MTTLKKLLCLCLCSVAALPPLAAQNYQKKLKKAQGIEVVYRQVSMGQVLPGECKMTVAGNQAAYERIFTDEERKQEAATRPADRSPLMRQYLDFGSSTAYRWAKLPDGKVISSASPFKVGEGFTEVGDSLFLGLRCKVVRTSVRSNTIEVWYTADLPFRGTPQPYNGVPDGLVLRVVRNGNRVEEAVRIQPLKQPAALLPASWGEAMDDADYQYALNHCQVITVPVFDQERVCFNGAKLPEKLEAGKTYQAAGGTVILKKVKLPDYVANREIFAEVVQYSDGDAYDRFGSVFIVPTGKEQSFLDALRNLGSVPSFRSGGVDYPALVSTPTYDAPLELMRFFTGFGVRVYNHNKVKGQEWVDSVNYKNEITFLSEKLQNEVWIGAYVGNWDKNGHRISLNLKYYPSEERRVKKVLPLFNTVNYMEQAGQPYPVFMREDSLRVSFTLTEDAPNAALFYLTTGHGGWGGGDEFNQKPNTIYLDGEKVITFVPWRDDCATYRNYNPCSGNFSNGLSSSDLSRSNWCPGSVTNPDYIYLGDLKAGRHTFTVQIPQGAPAGNSNSYWCLSGALVY